MFVNGNWEEGSGLYLKTVSPIDGSPLYNKKGADIQLVEEAALSAKNAFEEWSTVSFGERVEYLMRIKKILTQEKEALAAVISQETGKPLWECLQETHSMIEKITISKAAYRERCRVTASFTGKYPVKTHYKAKGALAVLGPFNFPGHLPHGHIIPALLAGNTIVYKPSEKTPMTGEFYTKVLEKANLPQGVFNMVQGGRDVGEALARSNHLDGLLFTGSYTAGKMLSKVFGESPQKILALEMGGNNPLIIDEVENIPFACFIAVQSAFATAGQRCSCARRLIIKKGPFADTFLKKLVETAKHLRVGSSNDCFMGPLITLEARDHLLKAQEKLLAMGGKALLHAEKLPGKGAFVTAGIIDSTSIKERDDEEIFGPLLQVILVNDFEEALHEANNTRFGLTASLVSEKKHLYDLFQKKIRAGIVNWNTPTTGASSKSSFGGLKESGNHRPSAFFAADYCASPVASMEVETLSVPKILPPGLAV